MRSLGLKLVAAFLLVSVTGAVLAALFAHWATQQAFDRLVLDQAQSNFVAQATTYYQANGSWTGIVEYFGPPPQPLPQPAPQNRPPQQQPQVVFALVDQDQRVQVPAGSYRLGDRVPLAEVERGEPIEVDGQVVGTVLATGKLPELDPREKAYLDRTNQASLYAALGAAAVALVLGVLLARALARPLRELTAAIRSMAQGELEQRVPVRSQDELGQLAAAFNQMSADLARSNALRRQMTADIAHDLRTPLTVIAGYLESLRDGVLKPSPARFEAMHDEAQHLQRLVEDLRTLSLADAGELSLNRQAVPPRELLERVQVAYGHRAEQSGVSLEWEVEAGLPTLEVDPDRMLQVLGNLVSNALRHTPQGGQITLQVERQAQGVLLSVRDTGEGIPPDALPHVFERFYRGAPSRQGQKGKSGLGLAIAQSIVEAHGGTIWVESILGEGTTFKIELPAREA